MSPGTSERDKEAPTTSTDVRRLGTAHRSLRDVTTHEIRAAILSGRFRPGERLVEDKLAADFGVSRNPVRESLRALEAEGLVEIRPRRGAFVATLSDEEVRELIELRASLEGLSARLATRRRSAELAARIDDLLQRGDAAAAAEDGEVLVQLNHEYHTMLAQAGANRHLSEIMQHLRAKTHWLFGALMISRFQQSWQEHAAILRAILAGDEELAALLASRHVVDVGRDFLSRKGAEGTNSASTLNVLVPPAPHAAAES